MQLITRDQLRTHQVPAGAITLWWLGQTGFLVKSPAGQLMAVDPYLTNACKSIGDQHGVNMDRLVPPPLAPADLVDIGLYAMTHSHADHLDPETLAGYRAAGGQGPYAAPAETVLKLAELGVPGAQTILMWPNKTHRLGDLWLRATFAIPLGADDLTHVGYVIGVDDGPVVYMTGDTAYHEVLADAVAPHRPDVLVAVVNGAFRNLSPAEAARLARQLGVHVAIPCHYDLFPDNSLPPRLFRTNLLLEGIADRYHELEHGVPFTYQRPAPGGA
ncbi:MAG: MBL fold metallo-hydrolase [Pirellulaceae bacterium]|jgi:L-ascorbate 6-phosphate lactonase|nr:MBL fold metallo-hydrolase [Pirellulaceae bacterium]